MGVCIMARVHHTKFDLVVIYSRQLGINFSRFTILCTGLHIRNTVALSLLPIRRACRTETEVLCCVLQKHRKEGRTWAIVFYAILPFLSLF